MLKRIASFALVLAMVAGLFCVPAFAAAPNGSAWAMEKLRQADAMGLIPDSLQNQNLVVAINRAELAAVCVKAYEYMTGRVTAPVAENPFTDTADPWVLRAYGIGLVTGTTATTYNPNGSVTRAMLATIFTNVYKRVYGMEILSFVQPKSFADDGQIGAWAKESVYFMAAKGVIAGKPGNIFDPADSSTREMTLFLTALMIEALSGPYIRAIEVRSVQDLLGVLYSGTFRLTAGASASSFSTMMDLYIKGEMAAMNINIGTAVRVVYRGGECYIISDEHAEYIVADNDMLSDLAKLPTYDIVPDVSPSLIDTGTALFDGKMLPYEEYLDASGAEMRFFFEDDLLAGWQGIVNGESAEMVFVLLEDAVADSVFEIPAAYTKINR